jgi:hypothetical protein
MAKSNSLRKRASSFVKSSSETAEKALPVVNNSLKNVGVTAKNIAKETFPVIEKGVSAVYGTMATGFNLGLKGAKSVASGVKSVTSKRRKSRRSKKSSRKTRGKR